jgi:RNA polymerase sigma-70 factor (ECF subfamily)
MAQETLLARNFGDTVGVAINRKPRDSSLTSVASDLKAGRREEFEELLREHLNSVYSAALRMSMNRDDAEDLTQEAIIRAYRAFDRFERGGNFRAWVLRILTNLYIDQHRAKARSPKKVSMDTITPAGELEAIKLEGDSSHSAEEEVLESIVDERIRDAIGELPNEYRLALLLCDAEGLTYAEAADALGVPTGTIRSRLFRARKMLSQKLADYVKNMGYVRGRSK